MSIVTQGFGGTGIVTQGFGVSLVVAPDESVTTAGGHFFGVPTKEAIDRRNLELYGIPLPKDRPAVETITLRQVDGSIKSYDIVRDRQMIESFSLPANEVDIAKIKNKLLTIGGLHVVPSITQEELDDEYAIVLLMIHMM